MLRVNDCKGTSMIVNGFVGLLRLVKHFFHFREWDFESLRHSKDPKNNKNLVDVVKVSLFPADLIFVCLNPTLKG